jgi:hypothetical protein
LDGEVYAFCDTVDYIFGKFFYNVYMLYSALVLRALTCELTDLIVADRYL